MDVEYLTRQYKKGLQEKLVEINTDILHHQFKTLLDYKLTLVKSINKP